MEKITAKEYKKALEGNRVVVVGTKYTTQKGWVGFRVFIIRKTGLKEVDVGCCYRATKFWGYECSAVGTNRVLEIILNIGYALGLEFPEITQRWNFLSEK